MLSYKVREGENNVNIEVLLDTFDFDDVRHNFTWSKDGQILPNVEGGVRFNASSVLFDRVGVNDSGSYTLSLFIYLENGASWNSSGQFILQVLCKLSSIPMYAVELL